MAGRSSEDERFRNALQTNPSEAISYLYDKYSKSLFRYAFMITKDEEHSKDIVQDAIVHIWKNRKKFSRGHTQSIHHYLVKSVRRRSLTYFRRASHIDWSELPLSELPINYSTVEVAIVEAEVIREIRHAISRFPKRERECLLMKIDKGMSPDDIAINLGVTRKSVERAITSANKRLRAWANENGYP